MFSPFHGTNPVKYDASHLKTWGLLKKQDKNKKCSNLLSCEQRNIVFAFCHYLMSFSSPFKQIQAHPGYDEDQEHELDSDATIRAVGETNCFQYGEQKILKSPFPSPSKRTRKIEDVNSSTCVLRRSQVSEGKSFTKLEKFDNGCDSNSYDEDDDEDYYPTSSDVELGEDYGDSDDEAEDSGPMRRIKPEMTKIEKAVIISTFIGTVLGIVIGYILFLSGNE